VWRYAVVDELEHIERHRQHDDEPELYGRRHDDDRE